MEGLLGSFNRYMDRKFKKDIYSLNKRTVWFVWTKGTQYSVLLLVAVDSSTNTRVRNSLRTSLALNFLQFDTRLNCCYLLCTHFRPQSLRFVWSRGRRNVELLVNDILRRVALGTRECFVLLLRLPFIREPVVSSQVISIVQKFRILNTSLLSLSLHLIPREGHHT